MYFNANVNDLPTAEEQADLDAMRLEGLDDRYEEDVEDFPTREEVRAMAQAELIGEYPF